MALDDTPNAAPKEGVVHCASRSAAGRRNLVTSARASKCTVTPKAHAIAACLGNWTVPSVGTAPTPVTGNLPLDMEDFVAERAVGEEPDGALLGPTCATLTPMTPQIQASRDTAVDYINPTLLLPFDDSQTDLEPTGIGELYSTEEQNLLGAFLSQPLWSQEDRLKARLDLLGLEVAAHTSSNDRYGGPPFDPPVFRRFFSASNVQSFAMLFCRKRHYRYPVIHWPTFTLDEASLPLLMVVALTGATYSYRPGHGPEHITEARKLYHLADSYVFHQLRIFLDRLPQPSEIDLTEVIQLCQAALLMYGLSTLLAGDSTMQRISMTERLPSLISAMRRLEFIGCRHDPSEDWHSFIRREQVVRLVTWAFCVDCLATLACNNPPIFSLLEMSGDLPCDPKIWDADSESAFELVVSSQKWRGKTYCLKTLMSWFLDDQARGQEEWENLTLFHLHIIMCAHDIQPARQPVFAATVE
ncbi:C2H2 transcription factor [Apiospora kogelbergensis]|uniref:C2H2 transcription factor n=1 Tax=Apiospora kogelbergensis TaxID=1337665 RepID=A0AAW0QGS9_9PEZI